MFHSVFQHITKSAHHVDQSTVALATLLSHLAKTYLRLNQIAGTASVKVVTSFIIYLCLVLVWYLFCFSKLNEELEALL